MPRCTCRATAPSTRRSSLPITTSWKQSTLTRTGDEAMRNTSVQLESLESRRLMSFGQPVPDFGVGGRASVVFAQGNANPTEMLLDGSGRTVTVSDAGL